MPCYLFATVKTRTTVDSVNSTWHRAIASFINCDFCCVSINHSLFLVYKLNIIKLMQQSHNIVYDNYLHVCDIFNMAFLILRIIYLYRSRFLFVFVVQHKTCPNSNKQLK